MTHLIRGEGSKELTDITLESGEVITATSNHPIWEQNDQNWTDAGKLGLDSILLSRYNDNNVSIVDLRQYQQQATVYNLTVNNDHTYFVGLDGVLGHNSDYCSKVLVNERIVKNSLTGSNLRTHQIDVSIPKISKMVSDMLKGDRFPAIKIDGNRIVEGHHRYIASKIAGIPIDVVPGVLSPRNRREQTHNIVDILLDEIEENKLII